MAMNTFIRQTYWKGCYIENLYIINVLKPPDSAKP